MPWNYHILSKRAVSIAQFGISEQRATFFGILTGWVSRDMKRSLRNDFFEEGVTPLQKG
jgi:hypothetical protein